MLKILAILAFIATISFADSDDTVLFKNPCTVHEVKFMEEMLVQDLAERLSDQAYTTVGMMEQFKDEFAQKLQNQEDFNSLLKSLEGKKWLRSFHWYRDEILPRKKQLNTGIDPSYLERFDNHSDIILPKLHKALRMILASFVEMKTHPLDSYKEDPYIKQYIDDSITSLKSVLCTFTTFTQSNDMGTILDLKKSEVPKITEQNIGLIYRDTLNFMEYLSQVFRYIAANIQNHICKVKTSMGISCTPGWYGPEYIVDNDTNKYDLTIRPLTDKTFQP